MAEEAVAETGEAVAGWRGGAEPEADRGRDALGWPRSPAQGTLTPPFPDVLAALDCVRVASALSPRVHAAGVLQGKGCFLLTAWPCF
jgi:hypothetical protein